MLIMKFGGTSVSSTESIKTICQIVKDKIHAKPVIVVSALSSVTNILINTCKINNYPNLDMLFNEIFEKHVVLANYFLKDEHHVQVLNIIQNYLLQAKFKLIEFYNKNKSSVTISLKDEIIAYGEKSSSILISKILQIYSNIETQQIVSDSCIITNNVFGDADVLMPETRKAVRTILLPLIEKAIIPVVTGFIGSTIDGYITTLGRGGSDYSAAILGSALDSDEIQIWTDVDGVYSADPKQIKSAKLLSSLTYDEASELAILGAKILHHRTIKPAMISNIPLRVLNTFNISSAGTLITSNLLDQEKHNSIKAITSKLQTKLISLRSHDYSLNNSFLESIFSIFTKYTLQTNLISISKLSLAITIDYENLDINNLNKALTQIEKIALVEHNNNYGSLSLIGSNLNTIPHLMRDIFTILDEAQINIVFYNYTHTSLSLILPSDQVPNALKLLHKYFIA